MSQPSDRRQLLTSFAAANKDVAQLNFISEDPSGIHIEELSGGLVNFCFRVSSRDQRHSVVLKYAEERAKGIDLGKISLQRQQVEYDCLTFLDGLVPGHVPEPYCLDTKHNIIAMQDMTEWRLLGDYLQHETPDLGVAAVIGSVLGEMHRKTSQENVTPKYWEELQDKFKQLNTKDTNYEIFYQRHFVEPDQLTYLPSSVRQCYQKYYRDFVGTDLQTKLRKLFDAERCLVQIDAHWRSIFVKDGNIAMFDFETAILGNPYMTVGYYVASYFTCFLIHKNITTSGTKQAGTGQTKLLLQFKEAVLRMLNSYMVQVKTTDDQDHEKVASSEIALFSGALMVFVSLFENIRGLDAGVTAEVQIPLLKAGFRLMKSHLAIDTIDQLVNATFEEET